MIRLEIDYFLRSQIIFVRSPTPGAARLYRRCENHAALKAKALVRQFFGEKESRSTTIVLAELSPKHPVPGHRLDQGKDSRPFGHSSSYGVRFSFANKPCGYSRFGAPPGQWRTVDTNQASRSETASCKRKRFIPNIQRGIRHRRTLKTYAHFKCST